MSDRGILFLIGTWRCDQSFGNERKPDLAGALKEKDVEIWSLTPSPL
jgi:hypothetical protein